MNRNDMLFWIGLFNMAIGSIHGDWVPLIGGAVIASVAFLCADEPHPHSSWGVSPTPDRQEP